LLPAAFQTRTDPFTALTLSQEKDLQSPGTGGKSQNQTTQIVNNYRHGEI
jgi:hypothetical protein